MQPMSLFGQPTTRLGALARRVRGKQTLATSLAGLATLAGSEGYGIVEDGARQRNAAQDAALEFSAALGRGRLANGRLFLLGLAAWCVARGAVAGTWRDPLVAGPLEHAEREAEVVRALHVANERGQRDGALGLGRGVGHVGRALRVLVLHFDGDDAVEILQRRQARGAAIAERDSFRLFEGRAAADVRGEDPDVGPAAHGRDAGGAGALAAGFEDYWTKPIAFGSFLAALGARFPAPPAAIG